MSDKRFNSNPLGLERDIYVPQNIKFGFSTDFWRPNKLQEAKKCQNC